jgi:hypothetical protein
LKLFGYRYPIEITLIRDNLIALEPNDGSSHQLEGASGRLTAVSSLAGIGALRSPMMSEHPGLNLTSIEQLEMKVGESCPQSFYICGKSFSADAGISLRTAKRSSFREIGDKRVGVATVPGFMVAASNFGGFHWVSFGVRKLDCGVTDLEVQTISIYQVRAESKIQRRLSSLGALAADSRVRTREATISMINRLLRWGLVFSMNLGDSLDVK